MEIQYDGQDLKTTVEQLVVGLLAFELSDIIIKYFFLISKFKAKQYANSNDCATSQISAKSVDKFLSGLKQNLAKLKANGSEIKDHFPSLVDHPEGNPGLVELEKVFKKFPESFEGICNKFGGKLENLDDKMHDKHTTFANVFGNFSLNYLAISLLFRY